MRGAGLKKRVGALISRAPGAPSLPAPPVIKEVGNSDFIEMDMHLARIGGQMRSSWIVEPADGRIPFTDVGKKAARDANKETHDNPQSRPITERRLIAIGPAEGPPT